MHLKSYQIDGRLAGAGAANFLGLRPHARFRGAISQRRGFLHEAIMLCRHARERASPTIAPRGIAMNLANQFGE